MLEIKNLNNGFDLVKEKMYEQDRDNSGLYQIRKTLIVFSLLYAAFSISDYYLVNEYWNLLSFIRFCIVIPIFIITIGITYKKVFVRIAQKLLLANFIIAGIGISFMLILKPDNFIYYGGMFMIYFSGYLLIRLSYLYSLIGGWTTFLIYVCGFIIYNKGITDDLIYSSMFFIGANIIGMIGCYNTECINRKYFLNSLKISEYNNELEYKIENQNEEIAKVNIEIVFALANLVEARDKCTGIHLENVAKYCTIITEGLNEKLFNNESMTKGEFLNTIEVASVLHDIGKVGIADSILNKDAKLSIEEFEQMKKHSVIGSEILEKVKKGYANNKFINMGIKITRWHHERYDGTGYPDGLKGQAIPLCARIMVLCDVYDALTSKRAYKDAYSHEKAVEIITNEIKNYFDPEIVEVFLLEQEQFIVISEGCGSCR